LQPQAEQNCLRTALEGGLPSTPLAIARRMTSGSTPLISAADADIDQAGDQPPATISERDASTS